MRKNAKTTPPETPKVKTLAERQADHERHLGWIMERVTNALRDYDEVHAEAVKEIARGDSHTLVACAEKLVKSQAKAQIAETILLTIHGGCSQEHPLPQKNTLAALTEVVDDLHDRVLSEAHYLTHSTCPWRTAEDNARLEARTDYYLHLRDELKYARQEYKELVDDAARICMTPTAPNADVSQAS